MRRRLGTALHWLSDVLHLRSNPADPTPRLRTLHALVEAPLG